MIGLTMWEDAMTPDEMADGLVAVAKALGIEGEKADVRGGAVAFPLVVLAFHDPAAESRLLEAVQSMEAFREIEALLAPVMAFPLDGLHGRGEEVFDGAETTLREFADLLSRPLDPRTKPDGRAVAAEAVAKDRREALRGGWTRDDVRRENRRNEARMRQLTKGRR